MTSVTVTLRGVSRTGHLVTREYRMTEAQTRLRVPLFDTDLTRVYEVSIVRGVGDGLRISADPAAPAVDDPDSVPGDGILAPPILPAPTGSGTGHHPATAQGPSGQCGQATVGDSAPGPTGRRTPLSTNHTASGAESPDVFPADPAHRRIGYNGPNG